MLAVTISKNGTDSNNPIHGTSPKNNKTSPDPFKTKKGCDANSYLWKGNPKNHQALPAKIASLKAISPSTNRSSILRDLVNLQKAFESSKSSDQRKLIETTIKTLPTPILHRLYFHLHLLHASKGKKNECNYGELAFQNKQNLLATNKDRSTALRNLLLEQLAIDFTSLGKQKSKTLKECFSMLPKEDRSGIYFNVYELQHAKLKGPNSKQLSDPNYGRTFFLKDDSSAEANRVRGNAIYAQLLKNLNNTSSGKAQANSSLQEELARLKELLDQQAKESRPKSNNQNDGRFRIILTKPNQEQTPLITSSSPKEMIRYYREQCEQISEQLKAFQNENDKFRAELSNNQEAIEQLQIEKETALKTNIDFRKQVEASKKPPEAAAELEEENGLLKQENEELRQKLEQASETQDTDNSSNVSSKEMIATKPLIDHLVELANSKINDLTQSQCNALRYNYALIHLKKMQFVKPFPHLQVQFEKEHTPSELPGCEFFARSQAGHTFRRLVCDTNLTFQLSICPKVANHIYEQFDRSAFAKQKGSSQSSSDKIAGNVKKLKSGLESAFKKADSPGTVLHEIQLLSGSIRQFIEAHRHKEESSQKALASIIAFHDRLMERLNKPASVMMQELQMALIQKNQEIHTIETELSNPQRTNRSPGHEERSRKKMETLQKEANAYTDRIGSLFANHPVQHELEEQIKDAESNSQMQKALRKKLKNLVLAENLFDELIRDGSIGRQFLQLEFILDRLPAGTIRRSRELRAAFSFIEKVRPALKDILEQMRDANAFAL